MDSGWYANKKKKKKKHVEVLYVSHQFGFCLLSDAAGFTPIAPWCRHLFRAVLVLSLSLGETYLIFASSALAGIMPQVAFSGLLGKSLKRQQFWDDSHHDHVSAQLKKGTQKQLPMLSKPQLSNVLFRCLHHYTWKGVTFGGWQHLFGVFPLSSMQENGNRSFHHPFVMKIVPGHTRLLLLQSLIPEPVNQLCEGFFFLLFMQSIGRSAE